MAQKEDKKVEMTSEQFDELMNRLNRLENEKLAAQPQVNQVVSGAPQAHISPSGQLMGEQVKHDLDKSKYPDPRERLYDEKEFSRFALRDNINLYWNVFVTRYPNAFGVRVAEPRFQIEMRPRRFEADGTYQGKEWVRQVLVMHEDPDAAIETANLLGVEVPPVLDKEFLDEMRYQRCKLWLKDLLLPQPPSVTNQNNNRGEMVIGGMVVATYENAQDFNKALSEGE